MSDKKEIMQVEIIYTDGTHEGVISSYNRKIKVIVTYE